jgi:putative redox protein
LAAERVRIRQDNQYGTEFLAADPENETDPTLQPVEYIHQMTPYGLLLASVGSCTAILLTSYAANHKLPLKLVELDLTYGEEDALAETILMQLTFHGPLNAEQRNKLLRISEQCPVEQMVSRGMKVRASLASVA